MDTYDTIYKNSDLLQGTTMYGIIVTILISALVGIFVVTFQKMKRKHLKFSGFLFGDLAVPITISIVFIIFLIGFGYQLFDAVRFQNKMEKGTCETLVVTDTESISFEENWYRDSFLGYYLIVKEGTNEIRFESNLSSDITQAISTAKEIVVYYGYFQGGNTIWKIDVNKS